MPANRAYVPCTCGHLPAERGPSGKCRATSPAGWPCDCQSVDLDDDGEA
jgi:hypothetical protein